MRQIAAALRKRAACYDCSAIHTRLHGSTGKEQVTLGEVTPRRLLRLAFAGFAKNHTAASTPGPGRPGPVLRLPARCPRPWIETRGYGLHHVGVRVESIHELIADMVSAGYEILQSGHRYGLDGDGGFAYFDTLDDFGAILEGIEVPRRRRPPDGVWPPTS